MRQPPLAWIGLRFLAAWTFTLGMSLGACVLACLVGPTRMWLIVAKFWGGNTLRLLGVRLHVSGAENLHRGPAVFISNHQSLIDVVLMPALLPRTCRIVAKRELLWVPFLGWAFAWGGAVLIDRSKPRTALRQIARGLARLPKGWSVTVFPEGTRPKNGIMRRFKRGAFHIALTGKLPIVPIGMDGARDIVAPDGWLVRGGDVWVHVGEPIDTAAWTFANINAHVDAGQAAVAECVGVAKLRRQAQAPAKLLSSAALG
jgi:1-acyl-sn-glycerol-3-phosphate acyltransferase